MVMFGADPYAEQLFQKNCASCHQAAAGAEARVPQIAALKTMTPAAILRTLESGIMKVQAAPLSGDERLKIATFLGTGVTSRTPPRGDRQSLPRERALEANLRLDQLGRRTHQYSIPGGNRCGPAAADALPRSGS